MRSKIVILFFIFLISGLVSVVFACGKNYNVIHENGLYIVKIDLNFAKVEPYVSDKLEILYEMAKKNKASVAINTSFFDAKNKKTVSYVLKNGEIIANPQENENLTSNKVLMPNLDKIYNRGELRILKCKGKIKADVAYHFDDITEGCELLSSTQAGPVILPDMDLEKEFFIVKQDGKIVRDAAGMTRRTDRSMAAIKDNFLYLIITDENNPLTIYELKDKLAKYNFDKALGFDGGGSVSLFVKQPDGDFYQEREEKGASREIKSALLVY